VALATLLATSGSAFATPPFMGLGALPNIISSRAYAVSADGQTIAGSGTLPNTSQSGFRWTASGGLEPVQSGLPLTTIAYALSGDGLVVGGYTESILDAKAYIWTEAAGPTLLFARGTLWAGSADGSAFAGDAMDGGTHQHHAVRWSTSGGVKSIEPTGIVLGYSRALGIDASGAHVVGEAVLPGFSNQRAFMWDASNGMVNIGSANVAAGPSRADAISADASTVVGTTQPGTSGTTIAFRWTAATGAVWLDSIISGVSSEAFGVSADGSTVVGTRNGEAFLWRADLGLIPVRGMMGADALGWRLVEARGVSADGNVVVGWGYNPQGQVEAWRAEVPAALAGVGGPAASTLEMTLRTFPNPMRGALSVRATGSEAGATSEASVLDLAGRVVRRLAPASVETGARTWTWDGRAIDGRSMPAGMYLVRVRVGNQTRVARALRVE
jgi:uncharacterized membrane protein